MNVLCFSLVVCMRMHVIIVLILMVVSFYGLHCDIVQHHEFVIFSWA